MGDQVFLPRGIGVFWIIPARAADREFDPLLDALTARIIAIIGSMDFVAARAAFI